MATNLTKDEAREIAKEAVVIALTQLGMDTSHPLDMQADMRFLRANRTRCESLMNKVAAWAVMSVLSAGSLLSIGNLIDKLRA